MSGVTTHVLDTALGCPAAGVVVLLEREHAGAWERVGSEPTDRDGRARSLVPHGTTLADGAYRLTFETGAYFAAAGRRTFYPRVSIVFEVTAVEHYHVPLLVSPFGYSTYRGS